jgi:hypothetical protein
MRGLHARARAVRALAVADSLQPFEDERNDPVTEAVSATPLVLVSPCACVCGWRWRAGARAVAECGVWLARRAVVARPGSVCVRSGERRRAAIGHSWAVGQRVVLPSACMFPYCVYLLYI